jgi:hypothetical protein
MTNLQLIQFLIQLPMSAEVRLDTILNIGPPIPCNGVSLINPTREALEHERQNPLIREIIPDPFNPPYLVLNADLWP